MKDKQKKNLDNERRRFIQGSLAAGMGAATAAVLPGVAIAADESPAGQPKSQQGYRLTAHILEYYKTTAS